MNVSSNYHERIPKLTSDEKAKLTEAHLAFQCRTSNFDFSQRRQLEQGEFNINLTGVNQLCRLVHAPVSNEVKFGSVE